MTTRSNYIFAASGVLRQISSHTHTTTNFWEWNNWTSASKSSQKSITNSYKGNKVKFQKQTYLKELSKKKFFITWTLPSLFPLCSFHSSIIPLLVTSTCCPHYFHNGFLSSVASSSCSSMNLDFLQRVCWYTIAPSLKCPRCLPCLRCPPRASSDSQWRPSGRWQWVT